MKLWDKVKSSIYNPDYYKDIVDIETVPNGIRYFLSLVAIVALVATIIGSLIFVPLANVFFKQANSEVLRNYPAGLEIKVKDGVATSNVSEPFSFTYIEGQGFLATSTANLVTTSASSTATTTTFLTINTRTSGNIEEFKKLNTLVLLTKDTVIFYKDHNQGAIEIQPIPNGTMTINKDTINMFFVKAGPMLKFFIPLGVLAAYIGIFVALAFNLLYLLLAALLVMLLGKFKKMDLGYRDSYKIALHAMTLPLILWPIKWFVPALHVPFMTTIILLIIAFVNLTSRESVPEVGSSAPFSGQ